MRCWECVIIAGASGARDARDRQETCLISRSQLGHVAELPHAVLERPGHRGHHQRADAVVGAPIPGEQANADEAATETGDECPQTSGFFARLKGMWEDLTD